MELLLVDKFLSTTMRLDIFHVSHASFLVAVWKMERIPGNMWKRERSPAWCDRILWRSCIPSKEATVLDYYSVPEISSSDHKPVGALFEVPTGDTLDIR